MKYKKAESQGAFIDCLRTKWPFKIAREAEPENVGHLVGVQILIGGQESPIYRFPGGDRVEEPNRAGIIIIEW